MAITDNEGKAGQGVNLNIANKDVSTKVLGARKRLGVYIRNQSIANRAIDICFGNGEEATKFECFYLAGKETTVIVGIKKINEEMHIICHKDDTDITIKEL